MPSDYLVAISVQLLWKAESDTCLTEAVACWAVAFGPECVKTPGHILAMISENFIAREAHETVYPG